MSASGANGPTKTAVQSQALDDLRRSLAIAPASGIDAIDTIEISHHILASPDPNHSTERMPRLFLPKK
jgi:hypothetical protein